MIIQRKMINNKNHMHKKGFTLVELLIVIAIIAVLTAILMPIFTEALEKSRESVDADNLRNAYSQAATYVNSEGNNISAGPVSMMQKTAGFQFMGEDANIGGYPLNQLTEAREGVSYYVNVSMLGDVTITRTRAYSELPKGK